MARRYVWGKNNLDFFLTNLPVCPLIETPAFSLSCLLPTLVPNMLM